MATYRDLRAWKYSMELAEEVYKATRTFPAEEKYGLSSQFQRAAVSVPANIAEGHGRLHRKEFVHHLAIARGSLREVETYIILATKLGFLEKELAQNLWKLSQNTGKTLSRLIATLHEPTS